MSYKLGQFPLACLFVTAVMSGLVYEAITCGFGEQSTTLETCMQKDVMALARKSMVWVVMKRVVDVKYVEQQRQFETNGTRKPEQKESGCCDLHEGEKK